MAELPDLTVFAQILSRRFKGKTLKEIDVKVDQKLKISAAELKKTLEGKKLTDVVREGKTLQFIFSGGHVLGLHLMLRGELQLLEKDSPLPKYSVFSFAFSGKGFVVIDILKQATPTLDPEKAKAPDALKITAEEFTTLLSKRKKKIKEVLMDQKAIRGIGNSYGDEILWDARISPLSTANAIPAAKVKKLYQSMQSVLKEAIAFITKENGDDLTGEFKDAMRVHGAKIEKSPNGVTIKAVQIGGRTAYYTDEQLLFS